MCVVPSQLANVGKAVAASTTCPLDMVVSTFVLHNVPFPRRVELLTQFLKISNKVLLFTWGEQSRVGFLWAIETFGTWKGDTSQDICNFRPAEEDGGRIESPVGSFTMARKETFQGIVDQIKAARIESFEIHSIAIHFASVKALLSFLPMPIDGGDCQAMWELLRTWNANQVSLSNDPDRPLSFQTNVVFCQISSGST